MSVFTDNIRNTPALSQVTVLEATWSDIPEDIVDEIRDLWTDAEFGNDNHYYSWTGNSYDVERYPLTTKYLEDHGVKECLIHYWW